MSPRCRSPREMVNCQVWIDGMRAHRIVTEIEMHLWMIRKRLERFEGFGSHPDNHGLLGFRLHSISQARMNVKRQRPAIRERHGVLLDQRSSTGSVERFAARKASDEG